jgi:hypothetical protein
MCAPIPLHQQECHQNTEAQTPHSYEKSVPRSPETQATISDQAHGVVDNAATNTQRTTYSAATSGDISSEPVASGSPMATAIIVPSVFTRPRLAVDDVTRGPCRHELATSDRSTL